MKGKKIGGIRGCEWRNEAFVKIKKMGGGGGGVRAYVKVKFL